ncbi:hypothetical protein FAM09_24550 [Niastella caeni]|uniref:Uncharacterized protein n=1 Tax=Niastella caeni TaxID=2569763 RepID=A0A4S8HGU1_9BACT|nr:hypothetical protein [Niastella caeni]THU34193.1 hypothetical protein FAM09_24550 [Niastella caeni]
MKKRFFPELKSCTFNYRFAQSVPTAGTFLSSEKAIIIMNFISVIKEATKAVPVMKYALGIAGIGSVIGLYKSFKINNEVGVWGTIIVLALMTILLVLAKASLNKTSYFNGPGKFIVWGMVILFISSIFLLLSCAFFEYPKSFNDPNRKNIAGTIGDKLSIDAEGYTNIHGHVYWQDNSPIPNALIIPSINHPSVLTEQNGRFEFRVSANEVKEGILFNIKSDSFHGVKNKRFSRDSLSGDCNIFIDFSAKVKKADIVKDPESKEPVVKKTDIVKASERKEPVVKKAPNQFNVCNEFVIPLRILLDSNKTIYDIYKKKHILSLAQRLYNYDIKIRDLISKNSAHIPDTLNGDIEKLVQHLNIWISAYEKQTTNVNLQSNSTFRVDYKGPDFPVSSVVRIRKYISCN